MNTFILTTEDTSDSPVGFYTDNQIKSVPLHYLVDGEEFTSGLHDKSDFFSALRRGAKVGTSQINKEEYGDFWRPILEEGKDVLHLAFASALSGTCANAKKEATELQKAFPDRKILVLDTCAQSGGQGLLARLVSEYMQKGAPIEDCYAYAEKMAHKIAHIFTVNDLKWLIGTGRVSNAEAFLGNLLQIKPILYTSDEGKLTPHLKVIGRKMALNQICEIVKNKYSGEYGTIYISHADCPDDVAFVEKKLASLGATFEVMDISPVIACHTGPEVLAVFFVGNDRSVK